MIGEEGSEGGAEGYGELRSRQDPCAELQVTNLALRAVGTTIVLEQGHPMGQPGCVALSSSPLVISSSPMSLNTVF